MRNDRRRRAGGGRNGFDEQRSRNRSEEMSGIYIGEIKIEGKKYTIEDGDLVLLKPSELYHCIVKDGTYHERLVLYFNSSLLKKFSEKGDTFLEPFYKRQDGYGNKISGD